MQETSTDDNWVSLYANPITQWQQVSPLLSVRGMTFNSFVFKTVHHNYWICSAANISKWFHKHGASVSFIATRGFQHCCTSPLPKTDTAYTFLTTTSGSKNTSERITSMPTIIELPAKLECISCIKCSTLKLTFGNNCNGSFTPADSSTLLFKNSTVKIDLQL